jgi:hypothetical protein
LQNLSKAFGSTALAQGIIESGKFSVQRLQAFAPLRLDAVDAIGDGELPRTRRLRGLGIALDDEALPPYAFALLRVGIRGSSDGLSLARPGQHQQPLT